MLFTVPTRSLRRAGRYSCRRGSFHLDCNPLDSSATCFGLILLLWVGNDLDTRDTRLKYLCLLLNSRTTCAVSHTIPALHYPSVFLSSSCPHYCTTSHSATLHPLFFFFFFFLFQRAPTRCLRRTSTRTLMRPTVPSSSGQPTQRWGLLGECSMKRKAKDFRLPRYTSCRPPGKRRPGTQSSLAFIIARHVHVTFEM